MRPRRATSYVKARWRMTCDAGTRKAAWPYFAANTLTRQPAKCLSLQQLDRYAAGVQALTCPREVDDTQEDSRSWRERSWGT